MYMKYSQGGKIGQNFSKFIIEDEAELSTMPRCPMGTSVYVIRTSETWMADSTGTWYPVNTDKDPIHCDCVEEMTIWNDLPTI